MPKYHVALAPFTVTIMIGERVASTALPDQAAVLAFMKKFAGRLPNKSEGITLLAMAEDTLQNPLQHYWCASADGWRFSFSGSLGEGAGKLREEKTHA